MRTFIGRYWHLICLATILAATFTLWAADEIEQSMEVRLEAGNLMIHFDPGEKKITQYVPVGSEVICIVGTAMETLEVGGDIGTNGIAWFLNTDTNVQLAGVYIDIGRGNGSDFSPFIRVNSGEFATVRLHPTNVVKVKASHANTILRAGILHD